MGTYTIVHNSLDDEVQLVLDLVEDSSLRFIHCKELTPDQQIDTVIFLGHVEPGHSTWLFWTNRCQRDIFISIEDLSSHSTLSDFYLPLKELCVSVLAKELFSDILSGNVDPEYGGPRILKVSSSVDPTYFADSKEKLIKLIKQKCIRRIAIRHDFADGIMSSTTLPGRTFRQLKDYYLARYVKNAISRFDKSLVELRVDFAGSENTTAPAFKSSAAALLMDKRSSNLVVLLGAPGSGKSVQLQSIDELFALKAMKSETEDSTICFCVNLGEHAIRDQEIGPLSWLENRWEKRFDKVELSFKEQLSNNRLVLLLDGFNEMPFSNSEDRRKWMLGWKACIHNDLLSNPKVRVVVACRSRDNPMGFGSEDTPATTATVAPLERSSILDMARRTSFSGYLKLKAALKEDASLEQLYRTPYTLYHFMEINKGPVPRTQSEVFWRRIASAVEREFNIHNPIIGGPWLPNEYVYKLINAKNSIAAVFALCNTPLFKALGALAFWMTNGEPNGGQHLAAINLLEDFNAWLEKEEVFDQNIDKSQFLGLAENFSILIENEGYLKFSHQSLQDFFCVVGESRQRILSKATLHSTQFEERLDSIQNALASMVPGDLLQVVPSTGFEEPLARLVEIDPSAVCLAIDANPWLMAEIFGKSKLCYAEHIPTLVKILKSKLDPEADVRVRLASLWALGLVGWQWLNTGNTPHMVAVERKTWRLGVTKAQAKSLNLSAHQQAKRRNVSAFSVGVFPVSNQEFEVFWQADGYRNKDFWSLEGWRWRSGEESEDKIYARWIERRNWVAADRLKPVRLLREGKASVVEAAAILRFARMSDEEIGEYVKALVGKKVDAPAFWNISRYNNPLQPVVGVSFFEAEAYCNWLTAKTGVEYRIPTEAEWEAAALLSWSTENCEQKSIGELIQPDKWSESWGNSAEMHLSRPSPVGALSTGLMKTARAPRDMTGNVFEWVTDMVNDGEDWCLVVKGGSFRHLMHRAHPGYRGRGDKTSRNDDNGFRVVASK